MSQAPKQTLKDQISAIVLAGGMGRRMGEQDKGLIELNGKAMIEYVIEVIEPQVKTVLISANRNQEDYARYGYPLLADSVAENCGPLAGIATGMQTANTEYLLVVPCDTPRLPHDLVTVLHQKLLHDGADICVAHDGNKMQNVFCLLRCSLLQSLLEYLNSGERKVQTWIEQQNPAIADFSESGDAFININTPEDITRFEIQ